MADYVSNAWYAAAWIDELATGTLLARQILDEAMVLVRSPEGEPAAYRDACPHRFAPLSRGTVANGAIVCGYHGLRFASADGACLGSPFAARIPTGAALTRFPAVTRHGLCWVWPGDGVAADPAIIPDLSFLDGGGALAKGASLIKADYRLAIDNLMDLSHLEFVHAGTFGGRRIIDRSEYRVRETREAIEASWSMPDSPAPRAGLMSERVDHWLRMRWNAPAALELEVGFRAAGSPPESGLRDLQAHVVTPAGSDACWYLWAAPARPAMAPDPGDPVRADLRAAFEGEDKPMLEAVQRNMRPDGDLAAMRPCYLPFDEAGMRVRRRLDRMIAAEGAMAIAGAA